MNNPFRLSYVASNVQGLVKAVVDGSTRGALLSSFEDARKELKTPLDCILEYQLTMPYELPLQTDHCVRYVLGSKRKDTRALKQFAQALSDELHATLRKSSFQNIVGPLSTIQRIAPGFVNVPSKPLDVKIHLFYARMAMFSKYQFCEHQAPLSPAVAEYVLDVADQLQQSKLSFPDKLRLAKSTFGLPDEAYTKSLENLYAANISQFYKESLTELVPFATTNGLTAQEFNFLSLLKMLYVFRTSHAQQQLVDSQPSQGENSHYTAESSKSTTPAPRPFA